MLSVKKLLYKMLDKISNVLGIGVNTVTVTTSAQGAARIDQAMPLNAFPILITCSNTVAFTHYARQSTGSIWARFEDWSGNSITNTTLNLTIYYVRKVRGVLRNLSIFKAFSDCKPSERMVASC